MTTPLDIRQFTNEELAQESLRRMNDTGDIFKDVEVPVEERPRIKNLEGDDVTGMTPYQVMMSYIGLKEFKGEKSNKIINVVKQIAPWEFELILFVKNFQEYLQTIKELTQTNPQIFKKIETAIMSEDVIFPCKEVYL